MKNKKMIILCLLGIGILLILFGLVRNDKSSVHYIMKINDLDVSSEEIMFSLHEKKQEVKSYLMNTYKIKSDDFDWNDKYGKQKGYEYLKDSLIKDIERQKVIQAEAIRLGIIEKFNYSYFLEEFEEENRMRKEKDEKGEVYFGPKEYSEEEYYKYYQSNLTIKVNGELIEKKIIKVTDKELQKTYINQKEYFGNQKLDEVKNAIEKICQEEKIQKYINQKIDECKIDYYEDIDQIIRENI